MTPDSIITLVVVTIMVTVMVREVIAPSIAITTAMIVLLITGVIDSTQALAGFSNPAPITVGALFILARAVEKTGAIQPLLAGTLASESRPRRQLLRLLFPTAAVSSAFNNTPIVAMLVPQLVSWARRGGRSASLYLMPVSFAAILGGMVTVVGTSTNLIVSGLLEEAGMPALGMFEMTPIGGPAAVLGVLVLVLLGPALLAAGKDPAETFDASFREYTIEVEVDPSGPLPGRSVEDAGLRALKEAFLVRIRRDETVLAPVAPDTLLQGGDVLGFVGRADLVVDIVTRRGLRSAEHKHADGFRDRSHSFFEAVVGPTSSLLGKTLAESGFREQYGGAVLAIHRAGTSIRDRLGTIPLRAGDTLLILSDTGFRSRWRDRRDFLLVADLDGSLPVGSKRGIFVIATAITIMTLATLGLLSVLKGALLGAVLMVVTGTLSTNEARNALNLEVLVIIGAAFGIGAALEGSGLAASLADALVRLSSGGGTTGTVLAVVLATVALTELITNNAAAVLMFPVAIAAAQATGGDPRSFAIAVALSASASFLTPVGYQTNTMVFGPGGYRFLDYARLGGPLTIVVVTVITLLASR